jgi:hypothetical protein
MTPSPSATFRDPLPADYGRAGQAKQRKKRKSKKLTKPLEVEASGIELIFASVITNQAQHKLDEMKRRALIRPLAEQAWRDMPIIKRAWLSMLGYSPVGYYERNGQ